MLVCVYLCVDLHIGVVGCVYVCMWGVWVFRVLCVCVGRVCLFFLGGWSMSMGYMRVCMYVVCMLCG